LTSNASIIAWCLPSLNATAAAPSAAALSPINADSRDAHTAHPTTWIA
jgi:hypothetical protein